jgi:hypothetical protein
MATSARLRSHARVCFGASDASHDETDIWDPRSLGAISEEIGAAFGTGVLIVALTISSIDSATAGKRGELVFLPFVISGMCVD